jgi:hypothetical protein
MPVGITSDYNMHPIGVRSVVDGAEEIQDYALMQ